MRHRISLYFTHMIPQRTGALPPWRAHRDCSCRRLSPELLRFFSVMGKSGRNASRSDRILIVLCSICACSLMCLEFQGWTLIGPNFKILNWKLFCKSNFLSEFANLKSSAARTKAELTFSIQGTMYFSADSWSSVYSCASSTTTKSYPSTSPVFAISMQSRSHTKWDVGVLDHCHFFKAWQKTMNHVK